MLGTLACPRPRQTRQVYQWLDLRAGPAQRISCVSPLTWRDARAFRAGRDSARRATREALFCRSDIGAPGSVWGRELMNRRSVLRALGIVSTSAAVDARLRAGAGEPQGQEHAAENADPGSDEGHAGADPRRPARRLEIRAAEAMEERRRRAVQGSTQTAGQRHLRVRREGRAERQGVPLRQPQSARTGRAHDAGDEQDRRHHREPAEARCTQPARLQPLQEHAEGHHRQAAGRPLQAARADLRGRGRSFPCAAS